MAFGASRPQHDIHATTARAPDVVRWAAVIAGVRGTLAGLANGATAWGLLFLVSLTTFIPGAVNLTSKLDAGVRQGATTASGTTWTIPDLVGSDLQNAQNKIQSLTNFSIIITTSHDATGAGRHQVLDRNWKVCSQNIPPGSTIDSHTRIDFGAVKLEERCP